MEVHDLKNPALISHFQVMAKVTFLFPEIYIFLIILQHNSFLLTANRANLHEIANYLTQEALNQPNTKSGIQNENSIIDICRTLVFVLNNNSHGIISGDGNHLSHEAQVIFSTAPTPASALKENNLTFFNREIPTPDLLAPLALGTFRFIPQCVSVFITGDSSVPEIIDSTNQLLLHKLSRPHNDYFAFVSKLNILYDLEKTLFFQDLRFKYGIPIDKFPDPNGVEENFGQSFQVLNFCSRAGVHINLFSRGCPALLAGRHFHVTSTSSASMVRFINDDGSRIPGEGEGFYVEIFKTASEHYNFTFEGRHAGFRGASGFKKGGIWRGAVGEVFYREVDFAICAGTTMERHHIVDPSVLLTIITRVFYVRKPSLQTSNWKRIFWPLDNSTWFMCLITVVVFVLVYYLGTITYYVVNPEFKRPTEIFAAVILDLLQILLEQGQSTKKWGESFSIKFILTLWVIFTLIVSTAYRDNLVTFLTFPEREDIPRTHRELVASDYKLMFRYYGGVAYLSTLNSPDPVHKKIILKSVLANISADCIVKALLEDQVACLDFEINGQFTMAANLSLDVGPTTEDILIRSEDEDHKFNVGWAFRKYSPLVETFDKVLLMSLASGLADHWFERDIGLTRLHGAKWLKSHAHSAVKLKIEELQDEDDGPRAMNIDSLLVAFLILSIGFVFALLAFVWENVEKGIDKIKAWACTCYDTRCTNYIDISLSKTSRKSNEVRQLSEEVKMLRSPSPDPSLMSLQSIS